MNTGERDGCGLAIEGDCPRNDSASGTTDGQGRFSLESLLPGTFRLSVRAEGYPAAALSVEAGSSGPELTVQLQQGAVLTGLVMDSNGRPLSGAQVFTSDNVPASSGSDGAYRLAGVVPGVTEVQFSHPDHEVLSSEEERALDIYLAEFFEVRGRVSGPEREPVARAMVHLSGSEDGAIIPTETDGSFSTTLKEGTYQINAAGHEAGYSEAAGPSFELRGRVEGIEIQLPKGIDLRGHLGGVAAEELRSASVEARSGSTRRFARTSESGYRIPGLSPGEWEVTAQHGLETATGRVRLEPGMDEAVLDLTFVPGSLTLAGRIIGAAELPSLAIALERVSDGRTVSTKADEKGDFRFANLPPGTYRLIIYGAGSEAPHTAEIELSSDREVLVNLRRAAAKEP